MQLTLPVGQGSVAIEYELAPQMVVFSHGFGVRRDARGMFSDIVAALPAGWGYVLFDYDVIDALANTQFVVGFNERLLRLEAVLTWVHLQDAVEHIHIVGHSMGALTAASLAPEQTGAIILLSPPLSLGLHFAELYTRRPGASHEGHTWLIPRSDGTTTLADDTILAELVSVDAEGELAKLALFRPYTIILADSDEVLQDADYTELITMPSVSMFTVERADHDFSGTARAGLVDTVLSTLTSKSQT
ncbi:alpha/beta hydrolase [Aeromicrobium sp.]|nr:alpha/beta hydrolase [Candidatus Saccharibacteria bacterium]